ncbi:cytochrome b [Paraglaciecola sp.]|uniref:cytochrome b n=1 Tax=Paraglaciecola sp. TaxID=1920173 RepID=UPI0032974ABF
MRLTNTIRDYGFIAKSLHWGTAALFLFSYLSVYFRHWFTESGTSASSKALQLHLSFGVTIGVVVVLRIIWRIANKTPNSEPGTQLQKLAAHIGHLALYLAIVIMVATGYMGTGTDTKFFNIFNIPKFADTVLFQSIVVDLLKTDFKAFEKVVDYIHKDIMGSLLMWMLIIGHVLAALYHHFILKDRTIIKMTYDKSA